MGLMSRASATRAAPAAPVCDPGAIRQAALGHMPSIRGLGVTFGYELVVACEVVRVSYEGRKGGFAVDVVFPEDARGLLEIVSWTAIGSVADAVTAIAVQYLASVLTFGGLEARIVQPDGRGRAVAPARVGLSTHYVRAALSELATKHEGYPPQLR
jgi:hypothetical protein